MENTKETKIRSLNKDGWYWIDKDILGIYGKRLKPSGLAVYNALAYFANSITQTCFPSQGHIAEIVGISRLTVNRKIKLLRNLGLITISKEKRKNIHTLLKVPISPGMQGCISPDTDDVSGVNTNKNNRTRIINNFVNDDMKNSFTERSSGDFKPDTREKLLAIDLAQGLRDVQSVDLYFHYAQTLSESLLRKTLSEVKDLPDKQIRKSRAALFNHIIQNYVKGNASHHRD